MHVFFIRRIWKKIHSKLFGSFKPTLYLLYVSGDFPKGHEPFFHTHSKNIKMFQAAC